MDWVDLSRNGFMKVQHSYLFFVAMRAYIKITTGQSGAGRLVPVCKRRIPSSRFGNKEDQDAIEDSACQCLLAIGDVQGCGAWKGLETGTWMWGSK
jgi:hypothetical protein